VTEIRIETRFGFLICIIFCVSQDELLTRVTLTPQFRQRGQQQ